ncbi:MAG TPA: DUF4767 domain-containing protein [Candidatus Limosilactobacillus excrementigallinarum]|nr:DUF4767 domain-containing protein [Candidatus Limosilactobacillus excrementigallinarum]
MFRKRTLVTISALAGISILLVGCGKSSPTNHSNQAATSSSKAVQKGSTKSNSSDLWNKKKDQELTSFINQWAPTMGQSYTKYDGNDDLKTKAGMYYPKDLSQTTVNGGNDSIGWAPSGKGSYDYNVVALYNYDRPGNAATHITYAFAFHSGEPVALVEQSTNGTPNWTPTKNTDVSSNFAKIANGNGSTKQSSTTKKDNDTSSTAELSFEDAAALIQKGGFTDFNYDSAKTMHDGSHPTSNGGYVMITYPGAKGQDQFTITKTGKNKYHIEAKYGTLDGGSFKAFDDQSTYGPTSADVTK